MNKQGFLSQLPHKFFTFMSMQLFITCISLPILISWGLPLSLLSPIGNLIFAPFLTAFLTLSSLIFFTQILCIPNSALAYALDILTALWLKLLSLHPSSSLLSLSKPSFFVLILPACIAILIMSYRPTQRAKRAAPLLALTLFVYCGGIKMWHRNDTSFFTITHRKHHAHVLHTHNTVCIIDAGALGSTICAPTWAKYDFLKELAQKIGTHHIDHLVATRLTATLFESIATLAQHAQVQTVYIPYWHGELAPAARMHYIKMKHAILEHGGTIKRIGSKNQTIFLNATNSITIEPQTKQNKYHNAHYPELRVCAMIDKESLSLYDAER